MKISRRQALYSALFGSGYIGLRALATGLPASVLADPLSANAAVGTPQSLILLTSSAGDPLGANVPGTYVSGVVHPSDAQMAKTTLQLGGKPFDAAKPWSTLPQNVLDRTCFFHHATLTNAHPNHPKVMRLMGATERGEMLASIFAGALAPVLGTVQTEPLSLGARNGSELLSFQGRALANMNPRALRSILVTPESGLARLRSLRDQELNRLNALFKEHGTREHQSFLDRMARSREESRNLGEDLLTRLDEVPDNGPAGQVITATVLAAMKVAPVISLKIPFGGDNHNDGGLVQETTETVEGVAYIADLVRRLEELGLADSTLIASTNVFGRTLSKKGTAGRDHNKDHHVMLMIGSTVAGGVVGGVQQMGKDWGAQPIQSSTGAGAEGGDIPFDETLGAAGKTLGAALGLDAALLDSKIATGKVVQAALRSA